MLPAPAGYPLCCRALQIDGVALIEDLVQRDEGVSGSCAFGLEDEWIPAVAVGLFEPDLATVDLRHGQGVVSAARPRSSIDHGGGQTVVAHARGEHERSVH